ncbi:MAG: D-glycero-D-manno-heptose 1,7-bisphosphate phosphatase [Granulosicoccus sp.]
MLKIGQITDLHLRIHLPGSASINKRRSRDVAKILESALQTLKIENVDLIVVTGDLIDVPKALLQPNDYYDYKLEVLRKQCNEDYQFIKELLEKTTIPYMVLPGNHDLESVFWDVFDKKDVEKTIKGFRVISFYDREENNQAHRYDRERSLMLKVLGDENPTPQIHLQHYVVHPELNEDYLYTYYDADNIKKYIINSNKVKLLISGHYHSGTDLLSIEGTSFVTGPSFSEYPHPVTTYEIDDQLVTKKRIDILKKPLYSGKPIAFLDRDGVINTLSSYSTGPDLLILTENAGKAISNLHEAGYIVVVITSQSCVGYGHVSKDTVISNHDYLCNLLRTNGGDSAQPDLFLFSTGGGNADAVHKDLEDDSNAKPSTILPKEALEIFDAQLPGSFIVGDNISDLMTGKNLDIDCYLVRTGSGLQSLERLHGDSNCQMKFESVENLFSLSEKLLKLAK